MSKPASDEGLVKIVFKLKQDEDGYPPENRESVWARKLEGDLYELDNIPFFAVGISYKDRVTVEKEAGQLYFAKVAQRSGHSTIRVVFMKSDTVKVLREELRSLGCPSEQSHVPSLIAVDVPPEVPIQIVRDVLGPGEQEQIWEYEEACIQQ